MSSSWNAAPSSGGCGATGCSSRHRGASSLARGCTASIKSSSAASSRAMPASTPSFSAAKGSSPPPLQRSGLSSTAIASRKRAAARSSGPAKPRQAATKPCTAKCSTAWGKAWMRSAKASKAARTCSQVNARRSPPAKSGTNSSRRKAKRPGKNSAATSATPIDAGCGLSAACACHHASKVSESEVSTVQSSTKSASCAKATAAVGAPCNIGPVMPYSWAMRALAEASLPSNGLHNVSKCSHAASGELRFRASSLNSPSSAVSGPVAHNTTKAVRSSGGVGGRSVVLDTRITRRG